MDWQPIETAPKDTAILVYRNGFQIAHLNSVHKRWIGYGWDTADTINMNISAPTHWMALPDPPKEER